MEPRTSLFGDDLSLMEVATNQGRANKSEASVELITFHGYSTTLTESDMVGTEADRERTFAIFQKYACVSCRKVYMHATKLSKCPHTLCEPCCSNQNTPNVTCPSGCEHTYSDSKQALVSWGQAALEILWAVEINCPFCKSKPTNPKKIEFHQQYRHSMQPTPRTATLEFNSGCFQRAIGTGSDSESAPVRSQPSQSRIPLPPGMVVGSILLGNKIGNFCQIEDPDDKAGRVSRPNRSKKSGGCSGPNRSRSPRSQSSSPSINNFGQDPFFSEETFNKEFSTGLFRNSSGNASKKAFSGDLFDENSQEQSADRKGAPPVGVEINLTSRTVHGKVEITTKTSVSDPDNTLNISVNEDGTVIITGREEHTEDFGSMNTGE